MSAVMLAAFARITLDSIVFLNSKDKRSKRSAVIKSRQSAYLVGSFVGAVWANTDVGVANHRNVVSVIVPSFI